MNNPASTLGSLKGGLDIPATHAGYRSLRIEHPHRTLTHRVCTRAERTGMPAPAHMALSRLKGAARGSSAESNKAPATVPFLPGLVGRSLKPQIHVNMNGRRRDGQRPNRTTSVPPSSMSRWTNSTGAPRESETLWFSITPEHPGSSTPQRKTRHMKGPLGLIRPTAPLAPRIKTKNKTKLERF